MAATDQLNFFVAQTQKIIMGNFFEFLTSHGSHTADGPRHTCMNSTRGVQAWPPGEWLGP